MIERGLLQFLIKFKYIIKQAMIYLYELKI